MLKVHQSNFTEMRDFDILIQLFCLKHSSLAPTTYGNLDEVSLVALLSQLASVQLQGLNHLRIYSLIILWLEQSGFCSVDLK